MATTLERLATILNDIKARAAYVCDAPETTTGRIVALAEDGLRVIGEAVSQPMTVTESAAPQSSVTLTQGAKGETRVEVKVYSANVVVASTLATEQYEALVARYA